MGGEIGGVVLLLRERAIVRRFQELGATSRSSAKSLDEIGIAKDFSLARLQRRGILSDDGSGKWHLDEPQWIIHRRRRQATVVVLVLLAVAVAAILFASQR